MALTKSQIVKEVNDPGFSKKQSAEIIETLLEIIKRSLENGEDLLLDARRIVTFKCSGKLRDRIDGAV